MNKKAQMIKIVGILIAIIFFLFFVGFFTRAFTGADSDVSLCRGVCVLAGQCAPINIMSSNQDGCRDSSGTHKDRVCCFDERAFTPSGETPVDTPKVGSDGQNLIVPGTSPTIEVRMNNNENDKIMGGGTIIDITNDFSLQIWGYGVVDGRCTVTIYENQAGDEIASGAMALNQVDMLCTDPPNLNSNPTQRDTLTGRQNIINEQFSGLSSQNNGVYVLQVILRDRENNQVQSTNIRFNVDI
ncbi:MAG: hypothetical protein ACMXX7_01225 [Candidatus Woesearchaeota archaeon]